MANQNPFGMSFEELLQQASGGAAPAQETPTQEATGGEMSFEEMVARAQQASVTQPSANTEPPMNPPTEAAPETEPEEEEIPFTYENGEAEEPKKEETASTAGAGVSFDALLQQARAAQNAQAPKAEETPKAGETPKETPKAEETPKMEETRKAEEIPEETSKTEETPKAEETPKETPKKDSAKKSKSKAKKQAKEESPVDETESYKVDLEEKPVSTPDTLALEALFSEEELNGLRRDIRTLVRKEIKSAVVDAVKELLHEFSK